MTFTKTGETILTAYRVELLGEVYYIDIKKREIEAVTLHIDGEYFVTLPTADNLSANACYISMSLQSKYGSKHPNRTVEEWSERGRLLAQFVQEVTA